MNTHMKRYVKAAVLLALLLGAVALTACSSGAAEEEGGMALPEVWGYVTGEKFAQLEVADQPGVDTLVVKRVLAPTDAWLVVHLDDDGMPGDRVGLKHISQGESLDVEVPLKRVTTEKVIVAVHADKGEPDEFEFDMMKKLESPDRPYFVNEKELAKAVVVKAAEETTGTAGVTASETSMTAATADTTSTQAAPEDESAMDAASTGEPSMDEEPAVDSEMEGDSPKESDMDEESAGESESSGDEAMDEEEAEKPPAWGLLAGFALVNALIIAYAAGMRRGRAKAKTERG